MSRWGQSGWKTAKALLPRRVCSISSPNHLDRDPDYYCAQQSSAHNQGVDSEALVPMEALRICRVAVRFAVYER
ncbi:hypothetical protein GGP41_008744 [Bipolaris sorokiniana]|uniref:Uncharacterized protein n=1 Tax=Cochliobolus sativus TaxID=45130 RepID=A0A8H5Z8N0_COCSA|nr:hypothetical protein GGP41_008744 [Bipolaris sorokiniana]